MCRDLCKPLGPGTQVRLDPALEETTAQRQYELSFLTRVLKAELVTSGHAEDVRYVLVFIINKKLIF